jgi:hypothetical protein
VTARHALLGAVDGTAELRLGLRPLKQPRLAIDHDTGRAFDNGERHILQRAITAAIRRREVA